MKHRQHLSAWKQIGYTHKKCVHRYLPSVYRSEVLWLQSSEHSRICGYLPGTEMSEES